MIAGESLQGEIMEMNEIKIKPVHSLKIGLIPRVATILLLVFSIVFMAFDIVVRGQITDLILVLAQLALICSFLEHIELVLIPSCISVLISFFGVFAQFSLISFLNRGLAVAVVASVIVSLYKKIDPKIVKALACALLALRVVLTIRSFIGLGSDISLELISPTMLELMKAVVIFVIAYFSEVEYFARMNAKAFLRAFIIFVVLVFVFMTFLAPYIKPLEKAKFVKCIDCDGSGKAINQYGYVINCPNCDGLGKVDIRERY